MLVDKRLLTGISFITLLATLSACGGTKIEEAKRLAVAGGEAGGTLLNASTTVENNFEKTLQQDRFLRPLQASTTPPKRGCSFVGKLKPNGKIISSSGPPENALDSIRQALASRRQLAEALVKTYAGFNSLAQYDASGEVESGVQGVIDAANTLRNVTRLSPISPVAGAIVKAGATTIVQQAQITKLNKASQELRRALEGYREGLQKARELGISDMQDYVESSYALIIALWQRGYISAEPLINSIAEPANLGVTGNNKAVYIATDEGLCEAVRSYLEEERSIKVRSLSQEYDTQISIISALIKVHTDFEKDAVTDMSEVKIIIDKLRAIVEQIKTKEATTK